MPQLDYNANDFSSDFLINAVSNYNNLSDSDRSQYTDESPFTSLSINLENINNSASNVGFTNYITGKKAFGPTVHVSEESREMLQRSKTPDPDELRRRISKKEPLFRVGESIPVYDPSSGLTPQQFWSQQPSFAYAGLKNVIYGNSSSQQEEIEESDNIQQSTAQKSATVFSGGYGYAAGDPEGEAAASASRLANMSLEGLSYHLDINKAFDLPINHIQNLIDIKTQQMKYGKIGLDGADPYGGFGVEGDPKGQGFVSGDFAQQGYKGPAGTVSSTDPAPTPTPTPQSQSGGMGIGTGPGDGDGGGSNGQPSTPGGQGPFCWVARKVYGEDNPKWQLFRSWLCTQAPKWLYKAYGKYGERFAEWLDGKPVLQKIIRKWMDKRIQKYLDTQPKTAQEIGPC